MTAKEWSFVLTLLGGALEFGAFVFAAVGAVRGRNALQARIVRYREAEAGWEAAIREHDAGHYRFDPSDQNRNGELLQEHWLGTLRSIVGHDRVNPVDTQLVAELGALEVLRDQVRALRGPVAAAAIGVIASTAGGLLSIN